MTKKRYVFLILILGSLSALGPFSIDMYLPGFLAIAKDLNTSVARVSLSLSSYFIGISAGQLLYGPLLDRFGRKKPLYMGLMLYVLASAACLFTHSVDTLIALRFVQAIGSCAAAVAAVAMVRDLFPIEDNAKVFSLLLLVLGASPMIAPTLGGYVIAAFGWQAVFLILTLLGTLILLASFLWLPESYQPDASYSLKPKPILTKFWLVLREPQFYTYALAGAVTFSGLFAYVAGSAQVFMGMYKVSGQAYGWIFALLSVGFIGSSQLNSIALRYFRSEQIIPMALLSQSIIGLCFLVSALLGLLGLFSTIGFLFAFLCCLGFTNPNTSALSLAPFANNAGIASALMGALQMGIGSLASVGVSLCNTESALPMISIMAVGATGALLILLVGRRMIVRPVVEEGQPAPIFH
ncbi:MAG: multidrug effflux transporter [Spirosoma sp.]|nr:multidrug effflux transporter [Spirosoma sp.]